MGNFKYTNDHECIHIDGDIAWVGISKYAQDALGDLVYVELPETGKTIKKGDEFAVVESVKTAAEIYSPVDGEIIAANESMPDQLEMITDMVSHNGWIVKIKISDTAQLEALMDEAAYQEFLKTVD